MSKKSPDPTRETVEDNPLPFAQSWVDAQARLALGAGLSLLLVDGVQPPALVVSNNNSICHAIQSSSEHAHLCAPYCGQAYRRAHDANDVTMYECHMGLQCFAAPIQIAGREELAIIGGRAFVDIANYKRAIERFRDGDLKNLFTEETFTNVLFGTESRLSALATVIERTSRDSFDNGNHVENGNDELRVSDADLVGEVVRLRSQIAHQAKLNHSMHYFLEQISSSDPAQTYVAILMNSKELLQAERASLLVYDEASEQLTVKAAVGIPTEISEVSTIRLGEGIAGEVLENKRPYMVSDLEAAGFRPAPADRRYKTKSFISYPITIGGRRVGVLNVADKSGGGAYNDLDLSVLDIVGPQVALALERAEWQEKASQYQLMSITDPLTGLQNRRYLEERLAEEVNRTRRYQQPLSFLMIDIDDFKHYNDRNGHPAGDLALQMAAQELKASLRSADVASRYGGEEFSILLPQTSLPEAGVIAERMREKIVRTKFPHAAGQPLGAVTISIGVSTFSATVDTSDKIIWAADRALYEAKRDGKNKISFYHDVEWQINDDK
ncbi:MAG TPA: diguanylate cyclase [Pyrinomonadaceae bacterium]|jgi:diguanylate cyclase (GGDEF)-like protein|nr:diguanylate cyclase [Pyrinomonadaceae bacterium]